MPELILMRHAAAVPAAADAADFARPLSVPGRAAALQAAHRLAAAHVTVDRVLFSPARRTHETATIVAQALALEASSLQAVPELYAASPQALRDAIARCHAQAVTLLVVGHNPGISEFGQQLGAGADHAGLATAAFWRVAFDAEGWRRLLRPEDASAPARR